MQISIRRSIIRHRACLKQNIFVMVGAGRAGAHHYKDNFRVDTPLLKRPHAVVSGVVLHFC
jgi:hypothetical protein